jgi:hypothetical protein
VCRPRPLATDTRLGREAKVEPLGWDRRLGRRAQYNGFVGTPLPDTGAALRELVDEYRDRCLWFLRRDYYPATTAEAERVLDAIQRHGDRDGFRRAAQARQWLSRPSNATSVGS